MSAPAVSVVMAVYNGAAHLPETLASLKAQTFADWELVAVDDCSKDDSIRVLRAFGDPRIRVIAAAENGGPVVARNMAFAEARGRYVAGLDQDDISLPERFAKQVAFLDANPDTVLVSSAVELLIEGKRLPGTWPRPLSPDRIDWLMLVRNPFAWSSVMYRADAARKLDPFERPAMRYVEDFDLYHRLRPHGRLAQIDDVLMLYRCHPGGASQQFNATMRAHAELLLAERHAALCGEGGPDIAGPVVRHVMQGDPVPDLATLEGLFGGIATLREAYGRDASTEACAVADAEIAKLWWRLARAAIRTGRLPLHKALGRAPLPLGQAADLVASQLIGGVRAARRGLRQRA